MTSSRLEAFSDGVLAIIITIMVLELMPPEGENFGDLVLVSHQFITYLLSYVFVGTFWVNHHHLFRLNKKVTGLILWTNLILLFFMSLVPFFTAWVSETSFASIPVAIYGINFFICGFVYGILANLVSKDFSIEEKEDLFKGEIRKTIFSCITQGGGVLLALIFPAYALGAFLIYFLTVFVWIIPSTKIENHLNRNI